MPLHCHRRSLLILVGSASCLAALAGCGSSGTTGTNGHRRPSTQALEAASLKYADCMRSHGVPAFPDPVVNGNGLHISIKAGSGVNPGSPAFQSAQGRCRKLLPGGGGTPSAQATAAAEAHLLTISRCMRAHGVTDFPDPTSTAPSSPTGYSAIMSNNGATLAIPESIDMQSPAFKQAATTCHFPAGGPPGGS